MIIPQVVTSHILAEDKLKGPATTLTFLRIQLDSVTFEGRLPLDKLSCINTTLAEWHFKATVSKRVLLSLIGLLLFVAKVVLPGRSFLCRMVAYIP